MHYFALECLTGAHYRGTVRLTMDMGRKHKAKVQLFFVTQI